MEDHSDVSTGAVRSSLSFVASSLGGWALYRARNSGDLRYH